MVIPEGFGDAIDHAGNVCGREIQINAGLSCVL
jgi:hypothetical protein